MFLLPPLTTLSSRSPTRRNIIWPPIHMLHNNKIMLVPSAAPTTTVTTVPARLGIWTLNGPFQKAGRVNATDVAGMLTFCEARQAVR